MTYPDGKTVFYGYDALGRLAEIQKDGQMQTRYGYDAFGNRTWKEESGERTSYQYNVINQMVSEKHGELLKAYSYDKRGNLTGIQENGAWKKQYVYGAINRLEEAVDAAGKQARYQYNGLGHRVGKQEGVLPKEKLEKLDPQSRIGMEIGNSQQITYTLDLTRQYYNLLERTEENRNQRYFWDGNVAAYEENGERNYYLQDELGSPLRIEDSAGILKESYGYGAFGEDLYQNQGKIQPFGYTGYQRDEIAGTYYAQAREYLVESGRFLACDRVKGSFIEPITLNEYVYCYSNPFYFVDLNGLWITAVIGGIAGGIFGGISQIVTDIATGEKPSLKKTVSATIGGAVGGAVAGTGAGAAWAGAASGATSTFVEGIWDMADGTTSFTVDSVLTLMIRSGISSGIASASAGIFDKFTSKFTNKMGEKLLTKFSLHDWKFKYEYHDKRIRAGSFKVLTSLKMYGNKFFMVESIKGMPDTILGALKDAVTKWSEKMGKEVDWKSVVQNIKSNMNNIWENILKIKEEIINCDIA